METRTGADRKQPSKRLVIVFTFMTVFFTAFSVEQGAAGQRLPEIKDKAEVIAARKIVLRDDPLFYFSLLPGPLVLLVLVIAKTQKPRNAPRCKIMGMLLAAGFLVVSAAGTGVDPGQKTLDKKNAPNRLDQVDKGIALYEKGRYAGARAIFESCLAAGDEYPALRFNIALCFVGEKNFPAALDVLYRGLNRSPADSGMRGLVRLIEDEHGLTHQFFPFSIIDPDVPLTAAAVLFNIFFILLGLFIRTKKSIFIVFVLITGFLFFGTGVFAGVLIVKAVEPCVVVGAGGAPVRKIPDDAFPSGEKLSPGTALRFLGETGGYMLVETGTGGRGWVRARDIVRMLEK